MRGAPRDPGAGLPADAGRIVRTRHRLLRGSRSRSGGGVHGAVDEDEDIRVEVFDAADAIALLDAGHIESGPAVVILSWFARHRGAIRGGWT